MMNNPIIDKLVEERKELRVKLNKLDIFLEDSSLSEYHTNLLKEQRHVMNSYIDVLDRRIKDLI